MKTAAMKAPVATAVTPAKSETGPVQLDHSPPGSPTGTSPAATAPSAAPKKNGVITDESANTPPSPLASAIVAASPRKAKAPPRRMIPTPARKIGT
jgi:hypothetical protein